MKFPQVDPVQLQQRVRTNQQQIQATAVKPASLAQTTLVNTTSEILGPFALANGDSVGIRSIITNTTNPEFRLGGVPFCITFFEGSLSVDNIIGDQITTDYKLFGPVAMAVFTPYAIPSNSGGSDGNNIVYVTRLTNNTGGPETIYAITNTRVYTPIGGTAS